MKLTELIDGSELQKLCDSFTAFCGAAAAVIDLDGAVVASSGWRTVCKQFHRVNPHTLQRCRESDTVLASQTSNGESYKLYRCRNGLTDAVVPIIISNTHAANFFSGQFFLEPPDIDFFEHQAEEFHFDKVLYLSAVEKVPVYTEDYVAKMMIFLSNMVRVIGEAGLAKNRMEAMTRKLSVDLKESINRLDTLSGLLPICSSCKRIRNEQGEWEPIEEYVHKHSEAEFSHSLCSSCAAKLYPDLFRHS